MIIFDRVRYQNFLATGNVPIEVPLNLHASTLIVGRNGAGKSTMTEAVCFTLFGRALRSINKPLLVNTTNNRDTVVELWFNVGEHAYYIKRGIKPNVFEIHQDGVLLPQPASLNDYQRMLEDHIIGMNHKSFLQIVVLGSASYVPFMRLSPTVRREIVEDLLDIEIFSAMSALTKDELATVKAKIDSLTQQRTLLDEQKRMSENFTAQAQEDIDERLATIDNTIQKTRVTLVELQQRADALRESIALFDVVKDAVDKAATKAREFRQTRKEIETRVKKLTKERNFYESHDECPTCAQPITETFKDGKYAHLTHKETDAQTAVDQCRGLVEKYDLLVQGYDNDLQKANALSQELHTVIVQTPMHTRRLSELQAEHDAVQTPTVTKTIDINEIVAHITDVATQHEGVSRRRAILDTANTLLKDSGIKSRIIKHYLPIINKQINFYLTSMDFPIHFTLDTEFNEHIQSSHREEFAYDSFSEGEKKRIDLALLLTWRAIARMKNSAACNMLVLDEVFDSSLDASGTEEFLKIIQSLEKANVFVISHKTDQLIDQFHHVLYFVKERGFTMLRK